MPKFFQKFRRKKTEYVSPLAEARLLADVAVHSLTSALDMLEDAAVKAQDHENSVAAQIEALSVEGDAAYDERKRAEKIAANFRALLEIAD